jgi:chemotaxis protein MotA
MDITTFLGIGLCFLLVFAPIILKNELGSFLDMASVLIVVGGSLGATLASFPISQIKNMPKVIKKAFFNEKIEFAPWIDQLADLAEKARREGILALERELKGINDRFLKKAIQLAVDGNEVQTIEAVMGNDIDALEERHKTNRAFLDGAAFYAPAFGMLGTLIGLIEMLKSLNDPSNIGAGMAVALITTFYGSMLANAVFLPISKKLEKLSKDEIQLKNLILIGVMSIQSGDNPRVLRDKLEAFLAPSERKEQTR